MTKKLVIKEAWLLDDNGNKLMKLLPEQDPSEAFEFHVDEKSVRGGYGNVDTNKDSWNSSLMEVVMSDIILELCPHEVSQDEYGKTNIEISDALERWMHDLSTEDLYAIIENCRNANEPKRILMRIKMMAEKVVSQRQFFKKNKDFRNALIPLNWCLVSVIQRGLNDGYIGIGIW